jgi:lysophospholipase L1-like esterase
MRMRERKVDTMKKILVLCLPAFLIAAIHMTAKPRLYIVGDSTACIYPSSQYPRTGWAQVLQNFFTIDSVQVADSALSGRSSKSFYDEGHWTPIKNGLRKGDCVIIQFGHNDEKTDDAARGTLPNTTFKQYLSIYIDDAAAKGATPILATPVERNSWSGTTLKSTHVTADGDYPQAIRDLAAAKKIGLIDATKLTKAFLEKIGNDSATELFMNLEAGKWPNYPDGNSDNTHLRETGAKAVAQIIAADIARQKLPPLYAWIKDSPTSTLTRPLSLSPRNRTPGNRTLSVIPPKPDAESCIVDLAGRSMLPMTASDRLLGHEIIVLHGTVDGNTIVETGGCHNEWMLGYSKKKN